MRAHWVIVLALAGVVAGLSCKSNNISDTTNNYISQVVGSAGATVNGPGGSNVVIPAGALTADVTIKIGQLVVGDPSYPAIPSADALQGNVFSFEPHGQVFAMPVTVHIPAPSASGASVITSEPSGSWSAAASMPAGTLLAVGVSQFSFFAAVTGAAAPASLTGTWVGTPSITEACGSVPESPTTFVLTQNGTMVTGTVSQGSGDSGTGSGSPITGSVTGNTATLFLSFGTCGVPDGGNTGLTLTLTIAGNTLTGTSTTGSVCSDCSGSMAGAPYTVTGGSGTFTRQGADGGP